MSSSRKEKFIVFLDGPDIDNPEAALEACALFGPENVIVVLTGRPIGLRKDADGKVTGGYDEDKSRAMQAINVGRFKLELALAGYSNVRIYDGGIAPYTAIPDDKHFPEDRFADARASSPVRPIPISDIAREIGDAKINLVVGGPLTGAVELFNKHPHLLTKKRILGVWGMYGCIDKSILMQHDPNIPKDQFNYATDRSAGAKMVRAFRDAGIEMTFAITDATKTSELAVQPHQWQAIYGTSQSGQMLMQVRQQWSGGKPAHSFDSSAVFLCAQAKGKLPEIFRTREGTGTMTQDEHGNWSMELSYASGGRRGMESIPHRQESAEHFSFTVQLAEKLDPNGDQDRISLYFQTLQRTLGG